MPQEGPWETVDYKDSIEHPVWEEIKASLFALLFMGLAFLLSLD